MIERIRGQIQEMRALARDERLSVREERVSGWSPAEHLDHMCKVALSIVKRISDENAKPARNTITIPGRIVLFTGWIPRGIGKTPERLSGTVCNGADIEASLLSLEQALDVMPMNVVATSRIATVPHPRFGGLTPSQALRFLVVHTNHHLRIIDDVLGARRSS